jgi:hypothetical protein
VTVAEENAKHLAAYAALTVPPMPRRRRPGAVKMRKSLNLLEQQTWNVSNYLRRLKETIADDPDPRAIVALMCHWDDEKLGDLAPLFEWLARFADELAHRRARGEDT